MLLCSNSLSKIKLISAPVTRRRQRLSVEQSEDSKSPALNTPTKKRGGRRAKPELELIDENSKYLFYILKK